MTAVPVLRDTGSGKSIMAAATFKTICLGDICGYDAVPLYRVFVRANIFVGNDPVGVSPDVGGCYLPLEIICLVIRLQ